MSDEAARIARHYANEAREHLARDYGLVSLVCSEMLEIADLIERQAARIAELEIAAEIMKGNWQEGAVSL